MARDGFGLESRVSLTPSLQEEVTNRSHSECEINRTTEKPGSEIYYDPYVNRKLENPTTFFETLIHLLKASLGTGILAMPCAFHNAGYGLGLVATLAIGFLCTYCIHMLISAQYELCCRRKRPSMTYAEILEAALQEGHPIFQRLSPYADFIANLFILVYETGSGCIYFLFVASNVKAVGDQYFTELNVRVYMLILLLPFVLINSLRNLKLLAPFSTAGNVLTLISFIIIAYYLVTDLPSISTRQAIAPFNRFPLFFGTVLFAMEAIGVIMTLENGMADPVRFGGRAGVLNCAMLPITLLYTLVGFFGYLKYGLATLGSVTLNLPKDQLLAQAAKLMLAVAIYITHGLVCYVVFDILYNQKLRSKVSKHRLVWEYVARITIVLITFAFAAAIPNLELFISLIGAFCLSTMGLAFPALIQLLTFWDHYRGFGKTLFVLKNVIIIIIAVLGFAVGVTTSLIDIYRAFTGPSQND